MPLKSTEIVLTQERVFQIFGHITVQYATLDFLITSLLMKLIIDERRQKTPVRVSATIGNKLKIISDLKASEVKSARLLEDIKKMLDEAFVVAEERNRFMHDSWLFAPEDLSQGIIKRVSITTTEAGVLGAILSSPYTEEMLTDLVYKIGKLQIAFADLLKKLED